jgi:hypothetical protein
MRRCRCTGSCPRPWCWPQLAGRGLNGRLEPRWRRGVPLPITRLRTPSLSSAVLQPSVPGKQPSLGWCQDFWVFNGLFHSVAVTLGKTHFRPLVPQLRKRGGVSGVRFQFADSMKDLWVQSPKLPLRGWIPFKDVSPQGSAVRVYHPLSHRVVPTPGHGTTADPAT